MSVVRRNILIGFLVLSLSGPTLAQPPSSASVTVKVLGVGSDNTLLVERLDKPGTKIKIELRGYQLAQQSGACDFERQLAEETTKAITSLIDGQNITLINIDRGSGPRAAKAVALNHAGINIGEYLFWEKGLAQPTKNTVPAEWCGN